MTTTTLSAGEMAVKARQVLVDITGLPADTISQVRAHDDGWLIAVDMLELKTLQGSRDVLATYEVVLDRKGNLVDYKRVRRYTRDQLMEV